MTPLHLACGEGHTETAEMLIKNGAQVNCENEVRKKREKEKGEGKKRGRWSD